MGKTGAKFVIGIGFALIFLSLFVRNWKAGSAASSDAGVDLLNCKTAELAQEPLVPGRAKVEFPTQKALADRLGITEEDFKKNLDKQYTDAKNDVDKAVKDWNDQADKAAKGDWSEYKDWVTDMGKCYRNQLDLAKNNNYAQDKRDAAMDQAWQNAQVLQWRWLFSFVMYFGVLAVAAGAVLLSISGEGNEKLGALVLLAAVLWFICLYWGGVGAR